MSWLTSALGELANLTGERKNQYLPTDPAVSGKQVKSAGFIAQLTVILDSLRITGQLVECGPTLGDLMCSEIT